MGRFLHKHPFPPFNLEAAQKLIVGTLPPPRFTTGNLKPGDVNFSYGSIDGQLWPILERIFDLGLSYENTQQAIKERQAFLISRNIGVCDIVNAAYRDKIDASDIGLLEVSLRPMFEILSNFPQIDTLLFTGGNSKNGPEYFFRKLCREYDVSLKVVSPKVPRIHQLNWASREITTVSLTAPSGAANRAVGSMKDYKAFKTENPAFNTIDYRVMQYAPYF
ncbi:MAG: DNA glycosylase [Cytophagaceae bacterium]|nr:DNA glycosylase [Cytophagaceae bacterium]